MIELDGEKQPLESFDPDAYDGPVYTPEQIRARVEAVEVIAAKWKGTPAYAETVQMEIWALNLAANVMEIARLGVLEEAAERGVVFDEATRDRATMVCMREMERALGLEKK